MGCNLAGLRWKLLNNCAKCNDRIFMQSNALPFVVEIRKKRRNKFKAYKSEEREKHFLSFCCPQKSRKQRQMLFIKRTRIGRLTCINFKLPQKRNKKKENENEK